MTDGYGFEFGTEARVKNLRRGSTLRNVLLSSTPDYTMAGAKALLDSATLQPAGDWVCIFQGVSENGTVKITNVLRTIQASQL